MVHDLYISFLEKPKGKGFAPRTLKTVVYQAKVNDRCAYVALNIWNLKRFILLSLKKYCLWDSGNLYLA